MPEWSIGTVSKTVVPLRVPRVRIPLFPQMKSVTFCIIQCYAFNILNMHNICTRYYNPIYSFSSKVTSIPTISQYLRKLFKLTFFPLSMAMTVPKFIPCFQILYWDSPFSSRILRTCFDNSSIVILLLIPSLSPLKMR